MWLALISLYLVLNPASYLLRRLLAQRPGEYLPLLSAAFFVCFLAPVTFLLSFIIPHDLDIGVPNLVFLFIGSLIFPLYGVLAFRANRETDVGIFSIIANIAPIFTLAIAIPFLHETFTNIQFIGVSLLILSGFLAALPQLKAHSRASLIGLVFCILSAGLFGIGIAFESYMIGEIGLGTYIVYGWSFQVIWAIILAGKQIVKLPGLFTRDSVTRNLVLAWGGTSVVRSVAFITALSISSASLVSAATNFTAVTVVLAAYFFLHEREHMGYKWTAAALGILGLFLVAR